jgi:hypothetical protein
MLYSFFVPDEGVGEGKTSGVESGTKGRMEEKVG